MFLYTDRSCGIQRKFSQGALPSRESWSCCDRTMPASTQLSSGTMRSLSISRDCVSGLWPRGTGKSDMPSTVLVSRRIAHQDGTGCRGRLDDRRSTGRLFDYDRTRPVSIPMSNGRWHIQSETRASALDSVTRRMLADGTHSTVWKLR